MNLKPEQAYKLIHDLCRGPEGAKLSAPDHMVLQKAFQVVKADMKCFEVKEPEQEKSEGGV